MDDSFSGKKEFHALTDDQKKWLAQYEGSEGSVAKAGKAYEAKEMNGSGLSSVYYSYAKVLKATHHTREAEIYLEKALVLSDTYADERKDNITADECDVRQSILRANERFEDARAVIDDGLNKNARNGKSHTEALLLIGSVELGISTGGEAIDAEPTIKRIHELALQAENEGQLQQAIRIYRGLVRYYKHAKDTNAMHLEAVRAQQLITKTGDIGQQLKLNADLALD